MTGVDWLALWAEFAQATDNEQLEVAERIVYLDGRWDFAELSSSKLMPPRDRSSESELKKDRNGRCSAMVSPTATTTPPTTAPTGPATTRPIPTPTSNDLS
jgi:hypothetical protein